MSFATDQDNPPTEAYIDENAIDQEICDEGTNDKCPEIQRSSKVSTVSETVSEYAVSRELNESETEISENSECEYFTIS